MRRTISFSRLCKLSCILQDEAQAVPSGRETWIEREGPANRCYRCLSLPELCQTVARVMDDGRGRVFRLRSAPQG